MRPFPNNQEISRRRYGKLQLKEVLFNCERIGIVSINKKWIGVVYYDDTVQLFIINH
jgi:hypothetical protein